MDRTAERMRTVKAVHWGRFLVVPLLLWLVFLTIVILYIDTQRARELENLESSSLMQANLLAEQTAGTLGTLELLLLLIDESSVKVDFSDSESVGEWISFIRTQLLPLDEMDGLCIQSADGQQLFTTYHMDVPQLALLRKQVMTDHVQRRMEFSMRPVVINGGRSLVFSRSITDSRGLLRAVANAVVTGQRILDGFNLSQERGLSLVTLYDQDGVVHAYWDKSNVAVPLSGYGTESLQISSVDQIPVLEGIDSADGDVGSSVGGTEIVGGASTKRIPGYIVSTVQLPGYPMFISVVTDIGAALLSWDLTSRWNLLMLVGVIVVSLVISIRLGFSVAAKEQLQQHMMADLENLVKQRTEELHKAVSQLERISDVDSLTGAYTRRKLNQLMEQEIERTNRVLGVFSIIIMDLDNFKTINDSFGHLVGDDILIHVVKLLEERIGGSGVLARWGGDELLVLLPGAGLSKALVVAESLRTAVMEHPLSESLDATVSMGVAQYDPGESLMSLIRRADGALYAAKDRGRNRVCH